MALLYIEGFDCEGTGTQTYLTRKGWTCSSSGIDPQTGAARTGTYGLRSTAYNRDIYRNLATNEDVLVCGVAYRVASAPTITARIISFWDGGSIQVSVELINSLFPSVVGPTGTLATSGSALVINTWYYIEFKATIADSGSYELRVNGVNVASGSGDTKATSNAYANRVRIGQTTGGTQAATVDFDDFYLLNDAGSAPTNDFLGDCKVETLFPNGNGNYSQFTGSDGNSVDNYLLVDEVSPDDDSTYVEDSTVNDFDTYAMTNLATTSGTVYGVQASLNARKTDAGSRSVATVARLSATDNVATGQALADTYLYYTDMRETKPGGGAWAITDVNSAEFGAKVTA